MLDPFYQILYIFKSVEITSHIPLIQFLPFLMELPFKFLNIFGFYTGYNFTGTYYILLLPLISIIKAVSNIQVFLRILFKI